MPQIIQGDALTELKKLDSESIDCCITSPPYYALRDYKVDGQLGLEPTFQEYITKLVNIFDEVKRVLKRSGTCWVVIGDTYQSTAANTKNTTPTNTGNKAARDNYRYDSGLPAKSLVMIPERFAIAMLDDDRGDDYELNNDAPDWVKREIEELISKKQP